MKVRIPQQNTQQELMKKVQQFQQESAAKEEELNNREYEATAGGGAVSVKVMGTRQVKSIHIAPEVLEDAKDDPEMLEDLLIAALNEAIQTAEKTGAEEMAKLTAGLNLPNIPGF